MEGKTAYQKFKEKGAIEYIDEYLRITDAVISAAGSY